MHIYLIPKALQDAQFIPVRVDDSCQLASVPFGRAKTHELHQQEKADWLVTFPLFFGLNITAKTFTF